MPPPASDGRVRNTDLTDSARIEGGSDADCDASETLSHTGLSDTRERVRATSPLGGTGRQSTPGQVPK